MKSKTLTIGALLSVLIYGAVAAAPAMAMVEPPPSPPHELWSRPEDPELAQITADIFLLRRINEAGLTRNQIKKLIPVLEGILRDAEKLRSDVKRKLLQQRKLLLAGKQTARSAEAAKREIQQKARRFAEQSRKSMERTRSFLSSSQVERLTRLVTARPGGFFRKAATPPKTGRRSNRRSPDRTQAVTPRGLGGPSTVVLRRVIGLLKEKLRVI